MSHNGGFICQQIITVKAIWITSFVVRAFPEKVQKFVPRLLPRFLARSIQDFCSTKPHQSSSTRQVNMVM